MMKPSQFLYTIISFAICCFLQTPILNAQIIKDNRFESAIHQTRSILRQILSEEDYVGVTVSVGVNDTIVYSEGFGFAHVDNQESATPDHLFRIYSISKSMTGAAVAKLSQDGLLDVDAPIETYIQTLNPRLHGITSRQLVGHLSGVRHYKNGEWLKVSQKTCNSPFDGLSVFEKNKLVHPPGKQFTYSSFGYVLLSAVIEAAAGQPFQEYMESAIFEPSGMNGITLDNPNLNLPLRAQPYEYWKKTIYPARTANNTCKMGAGGFVASSNDLVRFGLALINNTILDTGSLDIMLESMQEQSGTNTEYGFGLAVEKDDNGRVASYHSGGAIGGRGAFFFYPEEKIVVGIAANSNGRRLVNDAEQIAQLFAATISP